MPLFRFDDVLQLEFDGELSDTLDANAVLLRFAAHPRVLQCDKDDVLRCRALRELLGVRARALFADDMQQQGISAQLGPAALVRTPEDLTRRARVHPGALRGVNTAHKRKRLLMAAARDLSVAHDDGKAVGQAGGRSGGR